MTDSLHYQVFQNSEFLFHGSHVSLQVASIYIFTYIFTEEAVAAAVMREAKSEIGRVLVPYRLCSVGVLNSNQSINQSRNKK